MAASLPSRDTTLERQTEGWMNDPYEHFGYHNTRIHSLPREEVAAVQLTAMNLRLEERRGQIKMLEKLADAQAIRQINSLDDMAPLLMPHDVYKSYPVSLLAKQQFGKLNTWLSRLTRYDPTGVDVSGGDIFGQHRHLLVLSQIEAGLPAFDDGTARPALAEIWSGSQARRPR
jgi:hypothetical protein